ncbi:hypothetical protein ACFW40_34280 [Streptomyces sp. NPDC058807]|uniref:hypothetical protein n=1 Tax=unclassified Streptomyces TaxID=2593676 RepID=UPI00369F83B2
MIGSPASAVGLFALAQLEVSLLGAPATVAVLASVRPEQAGTASGVSNTFRQVGSVFGVALTGTPLIQHPHDAGPGAMRGVRLDPAARDETTGPLSSGDLSVIAGLPGQARQPVRDAVAPIFTDGLPSASRPPPSGPSSGACWHW